MQQIPALVGGGGKVRAAVGEEIEQIQLAALDGAGDGAVAVGVDGVDLGAAVEQELGAIPRAVAGGGHEGRGEILVCGADVGSGVEEDLDQVGIIFC